MKDSDKERTKLTATFLSNLGLAVIVAGFVAPFATLTFRTPSTLPADWITTIFSLAWLLTGFGIHFVARRLFTEIGLMTVLETYLLVLPAILLGLAGVVYYVASRDGRSDRAPAE